MTSLAVESDGSVVMRVVPLAQCAVCGTQSAWRHTWYRRCIGLVLAQVHCAVAVRSTDVVAQLDERVLPAPRLSVVWHDEVAATPGVVLKWRCFFSPWTLDNKL